MGPATSTRSSGTSPLLTTHPISPFPPNWCYPVLEARPYLSLTSPFWSVPHYPEEDSKLRATSLATRRGGNCPNSLHVLAQLLSSRPLSSPARDVSPHLISCLPDPSSPATSKIKASFTGARGDDGASGDRGGVDLSRCIYRPGVEEAASSFVIRSAATGSRTIVNYNGLDEMSVEEFKGVVRGAVPEGEESWWHFEVSHPRSPLIRL